MEKGALLEISATEMKAGEYGEYGLVCYAMTLKNGAWANGCIRLS